IADNGAAPDLPAANASRIGAAVVAPFAGVVHVGLALLEQLAMAGERIRALHVGKRGVGGLDAGFIAIGPFDSQALAGEQAFIIGHELGQSLERGGGFENELAQGGFLLCRPSAQFAEASIRALLERILVRPLCAKTPGMAMPGAETGAG